MIINYAPGKFRLIYRYWRISGLTLAEARLILRELRESEPIPWQGEPMQARVTKESDEYF